jgi:hypothetical protein
LLLVLYFAHDMATTSGTCLLAKPAIALALVTFFTRSRHVLSAFSVCIFAVKWLRRILKTSQNLSDENQIRMHVLLLLLDSKYIDVSIRFFFVVIFRGSAMPAVRVIVTGMIGS